MSSERSIRSFDGEMADVVCKKCNWDTRGKIDFIPRSDYLDGELRQQIKTHHLDSVDIEKAAYGHAWYTIFISGGYSGVIHANRMFIHIESIGINEELD